MGLGLGFGGTYTDNYGNTMSIDEYFDQLEETHENILEQNEIVDKKNNSYIKYAVIGLVVIVLGVFLLKKRK